MNLDFSHTFVKQYQALPLPLQAKLNKQLGFLLTNLRYPSLHAKKYDEAHNIWQARVDDNYRFYFKIKGDTYLILSTIHHP